MQGVSPKRIGNASCSGVEAVEVLGSPFLNGLKLSPTGNKWCPRWRELVAVLSVLFFPLVSCRALVEGSQLSLTCENQLLLFLYTASQKYPSKGCK